MPRTKKVQDEPKLLSDTIDLDKSIDYEKLGDLAAPIPGVDAAEGAPKRRGRPARKPKNADAEAPAQEAPAAESAPKQPRDATTGSATDCARVACFCR